MLLTIILLSNKNDIKLFSIIKKFNRNSPNCKLLISDSRGPRDKVDNLIKSNAKIKIIYNQNLGIYPSLNFALKMIVTEYYLVLGLDDKLNYKVFERFLKFIELNDSDLLFAGVIKSGKKLKYLNTNKKNILFGPSGTFPSHTGGVAIRRNLHDKYGNYSLEYKVISDLEFISKCLIGNCKHILFKDFLCDIGGKGFSKIYENLAEYESMIIRNNFGLPKVISLFIYLFRVNKRILKKLIFKFLYF